MLQLFRLKRKRSLSSDWSSGWTCSWCHQVDSGQVWQVIWLADSLSVSCSSQSGPVPWVCISSDWSKYSHAIAFRFMICSCYSNWLYERSWSIELTFFCWRNATNKLEFESGWKIHEKVESFINRQRRPLTRCQGCPPAGYFKLIFTDSCIFSSWWGNMSIWAEGRKDK